MSMHATEVGGSQMAPELVYDLLSRNDEETAPHPRQRHLDRDSVVQSRRTDHGHRLVSQDVGTPSEGGNPPSLYQKYVGHDNNRDAFQTNQSNRSTWRRSSSATGFRRPTSITTTWALRRAHLLAAVRRSGRPTADPLVWREMSWYGAHMAYKEEEYSKSGVVNAAIYSGWGHMGFHWITPFHNIAGMLTESASARLATPLYIHPDQLVGNARNLQKYEEQTTFPNPWPGGWWRLRDIVERQKISAWATLDLAARNRETVLWNAYLKAKRQTERGAASSSPRLIVPAAQHDPLTALKMIDKLLDQGVEVKRAAKGFTDEGRVYGAGTYVVSMAQPKMGVVRWMLGRTFYPDNTWTRDNDGNPIRPYDMSTDAMTEFMGVRRIRRTCR